MSATGLRTFDTTLQQTNIWLNEINQELGFGDRQQAYHALCTVLHALRDRLTVKEVADLGAQLPLLMRGAYYEGWSPRPDGNPTGSRRRQDFLDRVSADYAVAPEHVDPELLVRAVFCVLQKHVSAGEIQDLQRVLPDDLRGLWAA